MLPKLIKNKEYKPTSSNSLYASIFSSGLKTKADLSFKIIVCGLIKEPIIRWNVFCGINLHRDLHNFSKFVLLLMYRELLECLAQNLA